MAVLLILGSELADVGKRLARGAREGPKVPIFADFGVVDETLAADPLQQTASPRRRWIQAKATTGLHAWNVARDALRYRHADTQ